MKDKFETLITVISGVLLNIGMISAHFYSFAVDSLSALSIGIFGGLGGFLGKEIVVLLKKRFEKNKK